VQVFEPDFELLKEALRRHSVVGDEAKLFPTLNHLFMNVDGQSSVATYQTPGHVAREVVETIAAWVKLQAE